MNPVIRNILAIVAGFAAGSVVNIALVMISGNVIPPPEGVDVSDMESMRLGMHLFEPRHFIFPFLAHSMGTLIGAYVAARVAAGHKMKIALAVGVLFLLGGISAAYMLPAPGWFVAVDLIAAYIPFAWFGGNWGSGLSDGPAHIA